MLQKIQQGELDERLLDFYIDDKHYRKKLNELYVKVKKGDKEIARPVSSYEEFIRERWNEFKDFLTGA